MPLVMAAPVLAIIFLYYWAVCATGDPFWHDDAGGYYGLLARALAGGHLYLPVEPHPALLALPNPLDSKQNEGLGIHDLALYGRHYYLYHGATPALLLFTPWYLATHRNLSQRFAAWLLSIGGYCLSCALLVMLMGRLNVHPPAPLFFLLLVALGVCQSIPFLLQRVVVYEVAIAGGYFCLSAAFYLFARALAAERQRSLLFAASGAWFGLAPGCRPHDALAAIIAGAILLVVLTRSRSLRAALFSREMVAFALPLVACAAALAAYNYARFDNPLEFGQRYQVGGATYQNVSVSRENLRPGLYYLLFCPPEFHRVFPYVGLAFRPPFRSGFHSLPPRYFLEPIAGAVVLCPVILAALLAPFLISRRRPDYAVIWVMLLFSCSCILFIGGIGLTSHRFEVDFAPALLLPACVTIAVLWRRATAVSGRLLRISALLLLVYGIAANLAIGLQGPYDEFLQTDPRAFVTLARLFSPIERLRPMLNPRMSAEALFEFSTNDVRSWALMTAGHSGSRLALWAELLESGWLRITSVANGTPGGPVTADVRVLLDRPNRMRVEFTPSDRILSVDWNGKPALRRRLAYLVTAPDQFTIGEDRSLAGFETTFSGRVSVIRKVIDPG
jgi:hypothetical protein